MEKKKRQAEMETALAPIGLALYSHSAFHVIFRHGGWWSRIWLAVACLVSLQTSSPSSLSTSTAMSTIASPKT